TQSNPFIDVKGTESLGIEREGDQVQAITVVEVSFTKSYGISNAIGRYGWMQSPLLKFFG
ncbi:MAG TPA: hypothetical protein DD473_18225, partial [Planctomycetaceae bacterium]|nr:hypothetical protein [Planctomycetaceae bacterium]